MFQDDYPIRERLTKADSRCVTDTLERLDRVADEMCLIGTVPSGPTAVVQENCGIEFYVREDHALQFLGWVQPEVTAGVITGFELEFADHEEQLLSATDHLLELTAELQGLIEASRRSRRPTLQLVPPLVATSELPVAINGSVELLAAEEPGRPVISVDAWLEPRSWTNRREPAASLYPPSGHRRIRLTARHTRSIRDLFG